MPVTSIEIPPDSKLHKRIIEALDVRRRLSHRAMRDRYKTWEQQDKQEQLHVTEREADRLRKAERKAGVQTYTDITVPYGYSMLMAAHTYLSSVFLSRTPVIQFAGRHGETEQETQGVEAYMDYNTQVGGHLPVYYGWFYDALRYGLGAIGNYWEKEVNVVPRVERRNKTINGVPIVGRFEEVKINEEVVGYEGNRLFNVRPYDLIPDPRVPLGNPEKGEFQGWEFDLAWNTVLRGKKSGLYINTEKLRQLVGRKSPEFTRYTSRYAPERPNENDTFGTGLQGNDETLVSPMEAYTMVVELSPKAWGLGQSEYPEKWVFTVVYDEVIIEAHPYGAYHNKFPIKILETEFDPYSLFKRGMLEHAEPLNNVMSWLFNTHFYNVRKTLNGEIVYDPSKVYTSDIANPEPGKRIRLRPEAMGTDVRSAVHILQGGGDVTASHMQDAQIVGELLQRVTGVTDNLMGVLNPGGRKTATEVRGANSASVNRLRTMAEFMSSSGFAPLSSQMLGNARQYYTEQKKFRIAGDTMRQENFVEVTPDMLSGSYDFVPVDGTLPIDRFALVNMWTNMFAQLQRMPQIMQEYDMGGIFAWVAQLGGLKNIQQFKVGDTAGMVPLSEVTGEQGRSGRRGGEPERPVSRGGGDAPVTPIPRGVPGVGPSG